MLLTDTIIWNAREYTKSPTSTLAALPNSALAVWRPRRKADSSTTSHTSNAAILCGIVTLPPANPAFARARTVSL